MVSEVLDSQNNWFKDFTVSNNLDLKDLTFAEQMNWEISIISLICA